MSGTGDQGDGKDVRARWRRLGFVLLVALLLFVSSRARGGALQDFTRRGIDGMSRVQPFLMARTFFSRMEYCTTGWNFRCMAPQVEVPSQTKSNPCGPGDPFPPRRTLFPSEPDLSVPPGPLQSFWGLPDAVACTARKVAEGGLGAVLTAILSLIVSIPVTTIILARVKSDAWFGTVLAFLVGVPVVAGVFVWLFQQLVLFVFTLFGAVAALVVYLAVPLEIVTRVHEARELIKLGGEVIGKEK